MYIYVDAYMTGRRRRSTSLAEVGMTRRSRSVPGSICEEEDTSNTTQLQEQLSSTYDGSTSLKFRPTNFPILTPLVSTEDGLKESYSWSCTSLMTRNISN